MMLFFILFLIISSLPAFYIATKKDFIVIPNDTFNRYWMRLIILYPMTLFTFLISMGMIYGLETFFSFRLDDYTFIKYAALLVPLLIAFIFIWVFEKYIIKNDIIQNSLDIVKDKLFIYFPDDNNRILPRKAAGTKYNFPKRKPDEFLLGIQMSDFIIAEEEIEGRDILFTLDGELIVSERVLSVFQNNNLTGYSIRPTKSRKTKAALKPAFYQITSHKYMPPVSEFTQIKTSRFSVTSVPLNNEVYYDLKTLKNTSDFNRSLEYFGANDFDPYAPQRFWIVSPKVKEIFISRFKQSERDFISIFLVDSEVSDDQQNETEQQEFE
ncbi:hypothetical protein MmiAt1_12780 [Methanimicrococcus sp. At1]|uniref:Uncharacterized protein n=1 Tax=Methanimicrococcus hacksteinii TaxID=3028293 RepID=A0ABU3VQJ9_9EURY|nr:hypothetical protein [Methanimicrococcus sp. At1]MDV0445684.1 hypothetical protein [Methanimicrococcus sp. At1]